jgi:ketosteroid isomerase-like protein
MKRHLAMAAAVLTAVAFGVPPVRADPPQPGCPRNTYQRTVEEVVNAHLAAFQAGAAQLVACDYANGALFVLPGAVARGPANIEEVFAEFFGLTGGDIVVTVNTLTIVDDIALVEYAVTSEHVVIEEGVDTFVVEHGLISAQTAHLGGLSVR